MHDRPQWITLLGFVVAVAVVTAMPARGQSLPRVGVQDGQFIEGGTGDPVEFRGFNYIRLFDDWAWHATFAPGLYDGPRADAALAEMGQHGFTVARVFIDHQLGEGVVLNYGDEFLSPQYMDNFVDFVQRAQSHGVYVIPSLLYIPPAMRYSAIIGPPPSGIAGINRHYLSQGHINAKAQYVADFVREVVDRDPAVLSSVFAWELVNEVYFQEDAAPFNQTTGTISNTASGVTYDLSDPASKQQMADDNIKIWANAGAAAIKGVDPDALVSVNVFTYEAVGRTGPGFIGGSSINDARVPARPLALLDTNLDYLDVHTYPSSDTRLADDLVSIEWDQVKPAADAIGMPIVSGEYGAHISTYMPTLDVAATKMRQHLEALDDQGFAGQMFWTYDTDEQPQLWNGRSGHGEVFGAYVAANREHDLSTAPAIHDDFGASAAGRSWGASLDDQRAEYGGVDWAMGSAVILAGAGDADGVIQRNGPGGQAAVVPYSPSSEEIVRLAANVHSPAGSADWTGLGFSDRLAGDDVFWNNGSLWFLLRGNGNYEAWVDGVGTPILPNTASAPGFVEGGLNQLELIYDVDAASVWLMINGVVVLDACDVSGMSIPILAAGFHFYADGAAAADFELNLLPYWTTMVGDFNADRVVNLLDINPFVLAIVDPAAYAQTYPGVNLTLIDPSGDGVVNLLDINPFVTAITGSAAINVPEPTTVTTGLLLLFLLSGRPR